MARSQRTTLVLLLVAALLVASGGAVLFVLSSGGGPEAAVSGARPSAEAAAPPERSAEAVTPVDPRDAGGRVAEDDLSSTVAWPVEVTLELVRPARMPRAAGAPPLGSGRLAELTGKILDARAGGVAAEIAFVAGANEGRVLRANQEGEFGATDLYPGLAIVEVRGVGIPGSVREVRLRQHKTEFLNVSYSLPGSLVGTVYDAKGEPLEGVDVTLDGQRAVTNELGDFQYTTMTSGLNLELVLRKEGYALCSGVVAIPAARHVKKGRYKFAMDRESSLRISIAGRIGGPDPTEVVILPANTNVARSYPWYLINPVRVQPGGSIVVNHLPSTKVLLRAFHEGAVAVPAQRAALLHPGTTQDVELHFEPAARIAGRVVDRDGSPVAGARVTVEAPDRVAATMFHLGELPMYLETEVIPTLPPAAQTTTAGEDGAFVFSTWSGVAAVRYLTAESPDGKLWGGASVAVPADEEAAESLEVKLEVGPVAEGLAELRIDFPGRVQALPVEVVVNGSPREPTVVPVDDVLHVGDLAEGTWRLRASWNAEPVFGRNGFDEFELDAHGELRTVELPEGAIVGQDEDTLLRAGKL